MIAKAFAGSAATRQKIYHITPLSLSINDGGTETILDGDHLVSVVTTLPGLMLGLDPFWGDGQGLLRMTYIHGHARKLFPNLAAVWAGRKHVDRKADGFESFAADTLHYDYDGPIVMDGELLEYPGGQIEIRATEPIEFVS